MAIKEQTARFSVEVNARHEAAHAVVAVQLGLPLTTVDIRVMKRNVGDQRIMAGGYTGLDEEKFQQWQDTLPDPAAIAALTATATMAAAGCVADGVEDMGPADFGQRSDIRQMAAIAGALGMGSGSFLDPAAHPFIFARVEEANEILYSDKCAAWDRVRFALATQKVLTGDQVRALVAHDTMTDDESLKGQ
jgi:hypothetical protein